MWAVVTMLVGLVGLAVPPPPGARDPDVAAAPITRLLVLDRCAEGCTFTESNANDSRTGETWLGGYPEGTVYTIQPFALGDALWDEVLACVTEIYAPYDIIVTDERPGGTTAFHQAVVAGVDDDLGISGTWGGVGPLWSDCSFHDRTISFTFANSLPPDALIICSVVAQETAHGFGLEHSFDCANPMTYLNACGRQFFRNKHDECGEYAVRDCMCGDGQNTHEKLLDGFGANDVPLPAPAMTLDEPVAGAVVAAGGTFAIRATGVPGDARGLGRAEVYYNGHLWDWQDATRDQTVFELASPPNLPDGVIDVEVRIYNDLRTTWATSTARITRGAACTSEATCLPGQHCGDGRCYWDPPTGVLGDACDHAEYCVSQLCVADQCSQECTGTDIAACPVGFHCTSGFCLADEVEPGGCCSAAPDRPGALLAQLGLAGLVLGGVLRRRR
jgi:hypothetical protein